MFVHTTNAGYKADGEQFVHGSFLIIFQDPKSRQYTNEETGKTGNVPELRAIVRHVKMSQCGHWMMANVTIGGFNLVLSGSYGSDGLPKSLDSHYPSHLEPGKSQRFTDEQKQTLWDQLVPIPEELQNAFWHGGGHNSAGKEGPALRRWASQNLKALRKRIPKLA